MSYSVETILPFDKQAKRLAKVYPSLKNDILELAHELLENPTLGTPLGNNCYKIRMAITSKGKGKRAGARVITHIHISNEIIYFLAMYDKSRQTTISDDEILDLLSYIE